MLRVLMIVYGLVGLIAFLTGFLWKFAPAHRSHAVVRFIFRLSGRGALGINIKKDETTAFLFIIIGFFFVLASLFYLIFSSS